MQLTNLVDTETDLETTNHLTKSMLEGALLISVFENI